MGPPPAQSWPSPPHRSLPCGPSPPYPAPPFPTRRWWVAVQVAKGGEDAYFISLAGLGGVAVADGVSGWADEGIDPAEYPRTLMQHAQVAYEDARGAVQATDIIR